MTLVGEREPEEVNEGLSQGTLESGILSAGSIDNGLMIFFEDSPYEIFYSNIHLQGIGYQDDIMRGSKTIEDTQAGIKRLEAMAETKLINFNTKKSCLIVMGPKNSKIEIEKSMEENPVLLYNKPMTIKTQDKYLGEQITGDVLNLFWRQ